LDVSRIDDWLWLIGVIFIIGSVHYIDSAL